MVECSTEELLCLSLRAGEPGTISTKAVLDTLGVGEGAVTSQFEVISGLSTLEQRGVIETRAVRDADRTAYELTDEGREHARSIEARLSERTVTVEADGARESLTLAEAAERFERPLAGLVAQLRDDVLVLDDVDEAVDPEAMPFVGREPELAWLEERLDRAGSGQQVQGRGTTVLYGQCARETERPYGPILAAIEELPPAERDRLTLGPFGADATRELVCRLVGTRRVPGAFVENLLETTGGNPLFVAESVTRMTEEGVVQPANGMYPETADGLLVPESVQEAVRARLDGLDDRTRRLLEVASLIGTVVPEPVLTGACDLGEVVVQNRVELLVESRLWDREDGETVRFVSDVVRETVREALDRFRELGDPVGEAESLVNLGLVALETDGGTDEEPFRAAIDLFEELDDPVGEHRCRALLGAAEVDRGEVSEGRQRLDAALAELRPAGMLPVELEALRRHVEVERDRGDADRVGELCERARERIAATDADLGHERARIESLCERTDG